MELSSSVLFKHKFAEKQGFFLTKGKDKTLSGGRGGVYVLVELGVHG